MNRTKLWFMAFILVPSIGKTVAFQESVYEENAKISPKDLIGIDIKTRDCRGYSPLMTAAALGQLELVNELLLAGADVDEKSFMEETALYLASREGHEQVVKHLLRANAKVNLKDTNDKSALMAAAFKGHSKIVTLLLKAGALVEDNDSGQRTALTWACMGGSLETVKILLRAEAKVNVAAIREACQLRRLPESQDNSYLKIIKALGKAKKENFDEDIHNLPAIRAASSQGLVEIVERLVDATYQASSQAIDNGSQVKKRNTAKAFIKQLLEEYDISPESLSKKPKRSYLTTR